MSTQFAGLHPNTEDIYKRFIDYRGVIDVIIDPKRQGEIIGIQPAKGGHHLKFRKRGTKALMTVTVVNTAEGKSAAIRSVRTQLPKISPEPKQEAKRRGRGNVPTRTYIPVAVAG